MKTKAALVAGKELVKGGMKKFVLSSMFVLEAIQYFLIATLILKEWRKKLRRYKLLAKEQIENGGTNGHREIL